MKYKTAPAYLGAVLRCGTNRYVEATTGFEPVIRVLQTLALPLGHVAKALENVSAESQNRTGDTAIFSRVLYQLSYLGLMLLF
jgi:hypothetical protein